MPSSNTEIFKGHLTITVHGAKELAQRQLIGLMDPYCKVKIGREKHRTLVVKDGGRNPIFEQSFLFNIDYKGNEILTIELVNKEIVTDDSIGTSALELSQIIGFNGQRKWLQLLDKDDFRKECGFVEISVEWKPKGGRPSETMTTASLQTPATAPRLSLSANTPPPAARTPSPTAPPMAVVTGLVPDMSALNIASTQHRASFSSQNIPVNPPFHPTPAPAPAYAPMAAPPSFAPTFPPVPASTFTPAAQPFHQHFQPSYTPPFAPPHHGFSFAPSHGAAPYVPFQPITIQPANAILQQTTQPTLQPHSAVNPSSSATERRLTTDNTPVTIPSAKPFYLLHTQTKYYIHPHNDNAEWNTPLIFMSNFNDACLFQFDGDHIQHVKSGLYLTLADAKGDAAYNLGNAYAFHKIILAPETLEETRFSVTGSGAIINVSSGLRLFPLGGSASVGTPLVTSADHSPASHFTFQYA